MCPQGACAVRGHLQARRGAQHGRPGLSGSTTRTRLPGVVRARSRSGADVPVLLPVRQGLSKGGPGGGAPAVEDEEGRRRSRQPGGGKRPLGTPTLKERGSDGGQAPLGAPLRSRLHDEAYGDRPGRSAVEVVQQVHQELKQGQTQGGDADLAPSGPRRAVASTRHPDEVTTAPGEGTRRAVGRRPRA